MSDRNNNDLAALLTPAPSKGVQFSQGVILSWDNETLHNQIEWRGITITDIPIIEGVNALTLRQGDVVGMLGWAPENAKGVGSWWILGKLSNPGETVADLNVTAKLFRFVTEDGSTLALFGKESDGDPTWRLYYGESDGQFAIGIVNNDYIVVNDRAGHDIFASDGATGVGLARPYLNYYIVPSSSAESNGTGAFSFWPSTASAAYIGMYDGTNSLWHPKFSYRVVTTTTGGGSVDWQILFDGTVAVSGNNTTSGVAAVPGWGSTYNPGDDATVTVNIRTAGGATRAYVSVTRLYGRQS
jgi:hypothetical protein